MQNLHFNLNSAWQHDINTVNEEKKFERRLSLGISTTADFLIISSFCEQLI